MLLLHDNIVEASVLEWFILWWERGLLVQLKRYKAILYWTPNLKPWPNEVGLRLVRA